MELPKTFEVYLERSPAMRILGEMVTFRFPAFIINAVILAATVTLLFESGFSLLSIMVSVLIFIPMFLFIQLRFINRGSYLLKRQAILTLDTDEIRLLVGYPLSLEFKEKRVDRSDIDAIVLRGDPTFGFYIEFDQPSIREENEKLEDLPTNERLRKKALKPFPARFGLWKDVESAREYGEEIAGLLKLPFRSNYSPDGEKMVVS